MIEYLYLCVRGWKHDQCCINQVDTPAMLLLTNHL